MQQSKASRAYRTASAHRDPREQEADVFRRVTGALRAARDGSPMEQVKAQADDSRLWLMLGDLLRDPTNTLPAKLRASIVSIGQAVQREIRLAAPDYAFLIAVNEDMTAGLSGAL